MKVAMILPSLKIGGGQKVAINIANNKKDVFFIIIEKRVDNFFSQEVEKNHKVYYLNKELGFNPKVFFKIWRILNKENPNIVHFHLGVSLYGLIPAFFKRKLKLVYTFHTVAQNDSQGLIRRLCKLGIKFRGMIPVAITETVEKSIQEIHNVDPVLIYNGIDLYGIDKMLSQKKNKHSDVINIIAVGQIWETKNHLFMIDMMKKLKENNKYTYKLTILGDGPQRDKVEKRIIINNLKNTVSLTGNVENVREYLVNSDIFLITSNYEGLSLATLEAMACGLPIISSDVGGMRDIVKDNGYLIRLNDIEGFVDKIETLSGNHKLREFMARESQILASKYDVIGMQEAYFKLYKELLQDGK